MGPFDSGTQYAAWRARNCHRCVLFNPDEYDGRCVIDGALGAAYLGDGQITESIETRMGYVDGAYTWDCPERRTA